MAQHGLTPALWIAALVLAARIAHADEVATDHVELDSARSHATFGVKVMWLVSVHGSFGKVQGVVDVDRFRNFATVDARLDANAVEMGTKSYEDWVKSDEFFDAAHYPDIHFVSEAFPLQRLRRGGQLSGTLTIRGTSQPVDVRARAGRVRSSRVRLPDRRLGFDPALAHSACARGAAR